MKFLRDLFGLVTREELDEAREEIQHLKGKLAMAYSRPDFREVAVPREVPKILERACNEALSQLAEVLQSSALRMVLSAYSSAQYGGKTRMTAAIAEVPINRTYMAKFHIPETTVMVEVVR